MNVLSEFLASQPLFAVAIFLVLVATIFRRIGPGFLAGWLGLTHESASRLSGSIVVGLWVVMLLVVVSFRAGGLDLPGAAGVTGEFLGRSWWIIILVVASLVWKRLR